MVMIARRDVFQAIADPTRRTILSLLLAQAMTPNALTEHFNSSRQAVSKHVRFGKKLKGGELFDLSESPLAYKNIDDVIEAELDLIKPLVKLQPIGVVKG